MNLSIAAHEIDPWIRSLELDLASEAPAPTDGGVRPTRPRVDATTTRVAKPAKPRTKKPAAKKPAARKAPTPTTKAKTSTAKPKLLAATNTPTGNEEALAQWSLPGDEVRKAS